MHFRKNFYISDCPVYLGIPMPTLLVKNVTEEVLKELKRLKVELDCKTWAELLELLTKLSPKETFTIKEKDAKNIKDGIKEFLELDEKTSETWRGPPSVLEEFRKSRRHGSN